MELTEDQKAKAIEVFNENPDLLTITKTVFEDDSLKGSSREGKAIRDFLIERGLNYRTTRHQKKKKLELTEEQKAQIEEFAAQGQSSYAIASLLFPDKTIKKLGMEQRTVLDYMQELNVQPPMSIAAQTDTPSGNYSPPKAVSKIIKKINDATGLTLEESKISRQIQICIERLGINLSNSRLIKIINNYSNQSDRDLFEHEFIRLTWDKPDLSADEVNLYMNVCKEIVNMEMISAHLQKLNDLFDESETQQDMTVRLAELIKAKSGEYHQCENRIENLTKKLQGDRSDRMKKRQQQNSSILSIVQLFQEEEERKNMVRIAEMQKEAIMQEANRLESMDMWTARVLGISKEDAI